MKKTGTSHKTVSEWNQVHVGIEPSKTSQTRSEWHHNTLPPSLHLLPFCQLCTPQKSLYMLISLTHPLNECRTAHQQGTPHCSLRSLLHLRQPISPCSAAIKVYTHTPICYTNYRLGIAHAFHSLWIQDRPYLIHSIAVKLQSPTSMEFNMHYTLSTTHPTAFHNPPMHTWHSWQNGTRYRMVWKDCGVI